MTRPAAGARLRAAAVLPLTGRYAFGGVQAAGGLRAWAAAADVRLRVEDCGDDPGAAARLARELGGAADVLFGPYGSGLARAAADALAGSPVVMWNHGAAAVPRAGARVVDVLAPADRYWSGLPAALDDPGVLAAAAVLAAPTPFGRAVAGGALRAITRAGRVPLAVADLRPHEARGLVEEVRAAGARLVIGCGRLEDDLALGAALAGGDEVVALVACGVRQAADALGDGVLGWLGPSQWPPEAAPPPVPLPAGSGYPAAQALAAGLVAAQAVARAGSAEPDALWDAARRLRTITFLGPFAVDAEGRQTAATPALVRWERSAGDLVMRTVWRPHVRADGGAEGAART